MIIVFACERRDIDCKINIFKLKVTHAFKFEIGKKIRKKETKKYEIRDKKKKKKKIKSSFIRNMA